MGEQGVVDDLALGAQLIDGAAEIDGIPEGDGRDGEIEPGSPVSLIFEGAVTDFAEAVKEHGPGEGPELTNWPSGTHNGTEQERHAAFLNGSGGMRSGLNPLWFSDASCRATQM